MFIIYTTEMKFREGDAWKGKKNVVERTRDWERTKKMNENGRQNRVKMGVTAVYGAPLLYLQINLIISCLYILQ